MKLRKVFFIFFIIFILPFLIPNNGFSQVKKEVTFPFSGFIKRIPNDFKYIVLKDINFKIYILPDTKIIDEKGKSLKIDELKQGHYVVIESLQNQDGFFAKKIVIKPFKGV